MQEANRLTQHLRDDLLKSGGDRLLAVAEAVHDLYGVWKESPDLDGIATGTIGRSSMLMAGLLRVEDPIFGGVSFYLYPRTPRHRGIDSIAVLEEDGTRTLRVERPGWFEPFGPVVEQRLDDGQSYPIAAPEELSQLVLPKRDFWILVPDPDDPQSGTYATWGRPPLGTPFLILCRETLLHQIERLRQERLIEFVDTPKPVLSSGAWYEVKHCMVVSSAWSGVFIENRDLLEALRPIVSISIGVAGGLRVPGTSGWLVGHGPNVTVFGFATGLTVTIFDENDLPVYETACSANVQLEVPWSVPGDYRIEARSPNATSERALSIRAWDDLRIADRFDCQYVTFGEYRLCGAALERADGKPL